MTRITAPGIYDLSMEEYHGDCCDGPSVSASVLHKMNSECPAKVWEVSPLNKSRVEDKSTKAFDFGRASHSLTLGEPEFAKHFVICPHDRLNANPGKQWNDNWKAEVEAGREKRALVRKDDFDDIRAMADARRRSPQCARAFQNGKPERSLIHRDPETGIYLKVRPDWLPDDPAQDFLQEYKTARTIQPRRLGMAVFDYGYHSQAALQFDVTALVLDVKPLGVAHIVQEKEIPYLAELKMFDVDQLEYGRKEYRRALRLFARCWELHLAGKPERVAWPGYTVDAQYFETPYYIQKKMENPDEFDRYADAARASNANEFHAPL